MLQLLCTMPIPRPAVAPHVRKCTSAPSTRMVPHSPHARRNDLISSLACTVSPMSVDLAAAQPNPSLPALPPRRTFLETAASSEHDGEGFATKRPGWMRDKAIRSSSVSIHHHAGRVLCDDGPSVDETCSECRSPVFSVHHGRTPPRMAPMERGAEEVSHVHASVVEQRQGPVHASTPPIRMWSVRRFSRCRRPAPCLVVEEGDRYGNTWSAASPRCAPSWTRPIGRRGVEHADIGKALPPM